MKNSPQASLLAELSPDTIDLMMSNEFDTRMKFITRLRSTPVDEAVQSGEVIGPMQFGGRQGRVQFLDCKSYYSRFRRGDRIELRVRAGRKNTEPLVETEVKDVGFSEEGRIRVTIGVPRTASLTANTDYFIYPTENGYMHHSLRYAVSASAEMLSRPRRLGRLGQTKFSSEIVDRLNPSQLEGLKYLLTNGSDSAVQGPPGTGKTQLLQALISHALKSGLRVGIAAFTHAAVDNALSRVAMLDDGKNEFCRVSRSAMIDNAR